MFSRKKKPIIQSQWKNASYVITGQPITGGMGTLGAPQMPHLPPPNNYRGSGQYAGMWNLFQRPSINLLALPASPGAGIDVQQQIDIDGLYASQPGITLEQPPQQTAIIEVE
jgi:hypothetical protein